MGAAIKRELAKEDVQVGILSCYINMIHPDLEIREQLLQKFESYLRHARYFGAAMVASGDRLRAAGNPVYGRQFQR